MHTVKLQNALPQAMVATESLCGFKKQVDMERKIQTIPDQMEAGRIFRGSGIPCLSCLAFLSVHLPFFYLEKINGVCAAILVFGLFATANTFTFAEM